MESKENTGLRYNNGKPKWSLVHFKSLEPMVRVLEYGMHKYSTFKSVNGQEEIQGKDIPIEQAHLFELVRTGADNWKGGMVKREVLESAMRHLIKMMDGEINDEESGLPHAGHLMCNAMFYQFNQDKK